MNIYTQDEAQEETTRTGFKSIWMGSSAPQQETRHGEVGCWELQLIPDLRTGRSERPQGLSKMDDREREECGTRSI
jgi:hypothetical protein